MRKTLSLTLAVLLMAVPSYGQSDSVAVDYSPQYRIAVADYYGTSVEATKQAVEAGILDEELPIVFYISALTNISSGDIVAARLKGASWHELASINSVTSADFYVHLSREASGDQWLAIYDKFADLKRHEFGQVKLDDTDIMYLSNLMFLYRHYNYSQNIIMNGVTEGKSFLEVHHQVREAVAGMEAEKKAKEE